jgi:hypothetical protein
MKTSFGVLMLLAAIIAIAINFTAAQNNDENNDDDQSNELEEEFNRFLKKHGKKYTSRRTKAFRLALFKQARKEVLTHNKQFENGEQTYLMSLNELSDLTEDEKASLLGAVAPSYISKRDVEEESEEHVRSKRQAGSTTRTTARTTTGTTTRTTARTTTRTTARTTTRTTARTTTGTTTRTTARTTTGTTTRTTARTTTTSRIPTEPSSSSGTTSSTRTSSGSTISASTNKIPVNLRKPKGKMIHVIRLC